MNSLSSGGVVVLGWVDLWDSDPRCLPTRLQVGSATSPAPSSLHLRPGRAGGRLGRRGHRGGGAAGRKHNFYGGSSACTLQGVDFIHTLLLKNMSKDIVVLNWILCWAEWTSHYLLGYAFEIRQIAAPLNWDPNRCFTLLSEPRQESLLKKRQLAFTKERWIQDREDRNVYLF